MNEFVVTINQKKKSITILNNVELKIGNKKYVYEISHVKNNTYLLKCGNRYFEIVADKTNNEHFSVLLNGYHFNATVRTSLQEKAIHLLEEAQTGTLHQFVVKAPMPGMILKVKKNDGDSISRGESVMILEAMKMENDLRSPASGTISGIKVEEGKAVEKGAILFSIE
ncbi:MAG: acetyl-CoA carboxylase biotin carboxyl carrier protein subunit [Ignavibacteria bacterium]|nr:acetyl-CoA carboxylase biotin carboxyl carrier protein subunit [Ignavibacteria bacterium]